MRIVVVGLVDIFLLLPVVSYNVARRLKKYNVARRRVVQPNFMVLTDHLQNVKVAGGLDAKVVGDLKDESNLPM